MAQATGTNWGALAQGLAPLAIGAAGYLTAQPNTTTTTASPQFLSASQQNLFNQGVEGLRQAGAQPYAANNWLTNYQTMLGGIATDPTVAQSFGQTAETIGGLSNQLGNLSGGATWINDPSRMTADITAAQNPWNNLVRDTTLQYAQQAADRGNAADRAGASAGMSGFGDRSQIALELGRDKRQQGLNSLAAQLNQQGYSAATQQANQNNTQARADVGAQSSLAQLQPQLAQQARSVMLNNAQLLGQEGTAQRDYATTNATNLINAGTKGMGTQTVQSTPANPFMQGLSSGLAAFSPAVQSGISGLVQSAPSIASGIGQAASSIWDGLSSVGGWIGGLFEDGGRVRELPADTLARLRATYATPRTAFRGDNWREKAAVVNTKPDTRPKYAHGGLARYDAGGSVPEEDIPVAPTEAFSQELVAQAQPPAPGPVTLGGAARRMPPPAPPARDPITVGGTNIEDEFIKRLMAGPNPEEMREARAGERRAMEALMEEYKPRKDDWRQNLADIGIGMANSGAQSFGTAFAKGVGHADARANERTNLERQARRELAKIQLDMSREGRKELTEAERTRLTTLAGVLRERSASQDRRLTAEGNQAVLREGIRSREDLAREAREARDERANERQLAEWNALLSRQEPMWQRAAENAAKDIELEDRPAFIEDFIQRRREEFEARTPRPGTRPQAPAATAGTRPAPPTPTPAPASAAPPAPPAVAPAPAPAPAEPTPATPQSPTFRRRTRPGDLAEAAAVASRLGVPAIQNPPWRGMSEKRIEDMLVNERKAFEAADADRSDNLNQAVRVQDLAQEFLALNARAATGTGALTVPVAKQIAIFNNSDLQRMQSITAELAPLNRVAGTGAVSNYDAEQLTQQAPSIEKTPAANKMILEYRLRAAKNLEEKTAFERAYFEANQTMQGAQKAWDEYKEANPLAIKTPVQRGSAGKGSLPFQLNENRVPWQQYFNQKRIDELERKARGG